jgi:hypothetical protein
MRELLPTVLKKYGLKGELEESQAFIAWQEIDKRLVGNTWPLRLRKGRLTIEVESSPQLMECVMMKEELLAGLNRSLQEQQVEVLVFKIASKKTRAAGS